MKLLRHYDHVLRHWCTKHQTTYMLICVTCWKSFIWMSWKHYFISKSTVQSFHKKRLIHIICYQIFNLYLCFPDEEEQQELMDVIGDPIADSTLLKRDHVFALLNFSLKGGSFQLVSSYSSSTVTSPTSPVESSYARTLVELEFAGVDMSLESRLRTSSMMFTARLGALYIRDVMTKGSLFPMLVSPQQKRVSGWKYLLLKVNFIIFVSIVYCRYILKWWARISEIALHYLRTIIRQITTWLKE